MDYFSVAFNFMLDNEDRLRQYKTVPDAPPGAYAISGINSASFPTDFAAINAIPQAQRGPAIEAFYKNHFWNDVYNQINSADVATRIFDAGVNMGIHESIVLLQQAINLCMPNGVVVDGKLGPHTLACANQVLADPTHSLLDAYRACRSHFYTALVMRKPEDQKYLKGWLARAQS